MKQGPCTSRNWTVPGCQRYVIWCPPQDNTLGLLKYYWCFMSPACHWNETAIAHRVSSCQDWQWNIRIKTSIVWSANGRHDFTKSQLWTPENTRTSKQGYLGIWIGYRIRIGITLIAKFISQWFFKAQLLTKIRVSCEWSRSGRSIEYISTEITVPKTVRMLVQLVHRPIDQAPLHFLVYWRWDGPRQDLKMVLSKLLCVKEWEQQVTKTSLRIRNPAWRCSGLLSSGLYSIAFVWRWQVRSRDFVKLRSDEDVEGGKMARRKLPIVSCD